MKTCQTDGKLCPTSIHVANARTVRLDHLDATKGKSCLAKDDWLNAKSKRNLGVCRSIVQSFESSVFCSLRPANLLNSAT